jgi:hypothetical protein
MRSSVSFPVGLAALVTLVLSAASLPSSRSSAAVDGAEATLTLHVRDEQGRPIAARARLVPATFRERARLGQWSDLHVVTRETGTTLRLPAGRYALRVSRGIEWSMADKRIDIGGGARVSHTLTLRHQIGLPGWAGADLHVHTAHSDDAHERGGVSGDDLRAEGVLLAAVTDHNHIGKLEAGVDAVAGAELTTWAPEFGHFNAFPLRELPAHRGTTPARLFAELARDPGVFVQVNHPRLEDHISYFALGAFDGTRFARPGFHLDFDGIEVWNGYDLNRPRQVEALLAEWRRWVARGRHLTATGGSDSHGSRGHLPGYPRTYVQASTSAELAPALKAGHAFVTNGPLLSLRVDGHGPGDTVRVRDGGKVLVELSLLAPDWMRVEHVEVWAGEKRILRDAIPAAPAGQPLRFTLRRWLDVDHARVLHAVVQGGDGLERLLDRRGVEPLAFTNPVYLERRTRQYAAR